MANSLPTIDPRQTGLLVMDFQDMALGAISEPDALLAYCQMMALSTGKDSPWS